MTGVNADGGFGDNSLASGLSAIVGTIGRCCLVQVLWLNVAGHTIWEQPEWEALKFAFLLANFELSAGPR